MRLTPALYRFQPNTAVWCSGHKRYHPSGVSCSMCLEDVYDAAVVGADLDTPTAVVAQTANDLVRALEVGSLMVQTPEPPPHRGN